jgi:polyhydroxyalkanoate synthesis regulator phasin
MNKTQPVTIQNLDDLIERMKEVFPTKDDLRRELNDQADSLTAKITGRLENTISEATDEVLNAVHDRFDIVENRLDRIENRLNRHLAI